MTDLNSAVKEAQLRRRQTASALDYVGTIQIVDESANTDEVRQTKREEFLRTLRTTMLEDKVRSGSSSRLLGDGLQHDAYNRYINADGRLTDMFRTELSLIGQQEAQKLEDQLQDLQPPEADFVGIKRRFCRVCESDCKGYSSANFLFQGSDQQRGEFPTFCKKCGCPAYFHNVAEGQNNFPPDLSEILKSNNIQSNDINWNCLLSTFMLERGTTKTISDIIEALKVEGIEVISYTQRYIQAEEAFLLRSRVVDMQFQQQNQAFKMDFKKTNKDNEIKQSLALDALHADDRSEQNPYFLEKISQQKEAMMREQLQVADKNGISEKTPVEPQPTQQSQTAPLKKKKTVSFNDNVRQNKQLPVISEADELNDRASASYVEAGKERPYSAQVDQVYQEMMKRVSLLPQTVGGDFRLAVQDKNLPMSKTSGISVAVDERHQIEFLMRCLDSNELLQQMLKNEIVFLILSSASVQNLSQTAKTVFQRFESTPGTRMLYFSQNKVTSLEDCVQFVPHLFRLSKSIMVSEQLSYTNGERDRFQKESYLSKIVKRDDQMALSNQFNDREVNPYRENSITSHYSDRCAVSIQSKLSIINRRQKVQRSTIKNSGKLDGLSAADDGDDDSVSQASWVVRAKSGVVGYKKNKLDRQRHRIAFNHGVMCDFFNYSGMSVQLSHEEVDFCKPLRPGGIRATIASLNSDFGSGATQPCNMFAIAKVGLPNLILPNTLDLKFSNYENFDKYIQVCDSFFPDLSINQHSVMILRPVVVRNGLADLFVMILRANEFVIVSRKTRILTGGEVAYLYHKEKIPESNKELYFDLMMAGPSEILVVSKLSAVYDAKTLLNGASPYGRRRLNQLHEDSKTARSNVDSVSAMFEIAPFTSFSELIDLEDFLGRNSKLAKFKKDNKSAEPHMYLVHKQQYASEAIKIFARFFNFTGFSSADIPSAETEVCMFAPECAALQEVVLILNPMYNDILDDAFELIVRQGFQILRHEQKLLSSDQVKELFQTKVNFNTSDGLRFLETMTLGGAHIFHLVKKAGDMEMRYLYRISDLQFEDLILPTSFGRPLKPIYFPYIFLFLDTTAQFENGMTHLYKPEYLNLNGKELFHYNNNDVMKILQYCLLVTLGDTMKMLHTDTFGRTRAIKPTKIDKFEPINKFVLSGLSHGGKTEAQFVMKTLDDKNGAAKYCSFMVESANFGVYEVRFLTHDKDPSSLPDLLQRFTALSLFYQEASKVCASSVPAFYKYKIGGEIKRVFEVEEYMGDRFMEGLAKLHNQHCKIVEMYEKYLIRTPQYVKPHSLPAHVFGNKLGMLCTKLSQIKSKEQGAGKFSYSLEKEGFIGEVHKITDSSFYSYDKQRYAAMLAQFQKGWDYFLSTLETDIIKSKLELVINSLTFRYSRQPKFLKLVPERLTSENLRITERIKTINPKGLNPEGSDKFFTEDDLSVINPDREKDKASRVESEIHTIKTAFDEYMQKIKALVKENKATGKPFDTLEISGKDFSIVNDVAISGFRDGIARRPIYHMVASLMWVLNFEYKKVNRCSQYFSGDRSSAQKNTEAEYDQIIDDIIRGMLKTWHLENQEAVDIKKMREEADAATNAEIRDQVTTKQKVEAAMKLKMQQELEEQNRNRRMNMDIDELIKTPELYEASVDEQREKQRKELQQMLDPKGAADKDGSEFSEFIEKSKTQFGPYATKIAESFVKKIGFQMQKSQNAFFKDQELISLVKMEYFLYGVAEANHLITQLRQMEQHIDSMHDELDVLQKGVDQLQATLSQTQADQHKRRELLREQNEQAVMKVKYEGKIFSYKLQIQAKEADLLEVFRELIGWDFYLPEDYFEPKTIENSFDVPIETFWKPIKLPERIETDYKNAKYIATVGAMTKLNEHNYGDFLPAGLREAVMNDPKTKERIANLQKGHLQSNLRKVDPQQTEKNIKLEEYVSQADANARSTLEQQEKLLKQKTTRKEYKPDVLI